MSKVQIKDVFELQMGKTPSRKNLAYWTDGDIDWVSIRDLGTYDRYVGRTKERITQTAVDESGIKPVPPNTLMMSFKLSLGKTAITVKPTYTNEAIMAFIDKGGHPFDLGFLFHQFSSKDWTAGTNMAVMGATLNKKTLSEAWIELPSEAEQRRIASLFDSVCDRIAEARESQKSLDELVKSRFVEMFGEPDTNPLGFESKPGSKLFKIGNGKAKPNAERFEEGVPAYGGNGVSWYTNEALVEHTTIVIGRVGRHCGNTRLVEEPCWVTDNAMFIKDFKDASFDLTFLSWLMEIIGFNRFADKGDLWKITQKPFMEYNFYVPPLALQQEFAAFVQQVDKLGFETQRAIDKLQMLYDSLAQEYFGGE